MPGVLFHLDRISPPTNYCHARGSKTPLSRACFLEHRRIEAPGCASETGTQLPSRLEFISTGNHRVLRFLARIRLIIIGFPEASSNDPCLFHASRNKFRLHTSPRIRHAIRFTFTDQLLEWGGDSSRIAFALSWESNVHRSDRAL